MALQRQAADWHDRRAFDTRDREMMARAAYERGAADQAMYQRHTYEEAVAIGATQERMRAEATAPRRVVAGQQVQMVDMMSGMALNVSQSVTVSGRGSMSGLCRWTEAGWCIWALDLATGRLGGLVAGEAGHKALEVSLDELRPCGHKSSRHVVHHFRRE